MKWKMIRQSSSANSFDGRCNLFIDEKISIINFKDHRLPLDERNEHVFNVDIKVNLDNPVRGLPRAQL